MSIAKNMSTRMLTEMGLAIALTVLLDFFKVYQMPYGGSVSLEMLPLFIIAFRWGVMPGILSGVAFGILQLALGAYVIHWAQFFLDYPIAFAGLGLAGLFKNNIRAGKGVVTSIILGVILGSGARFLSHFIGGVAFFAHFAPEGQSVQMYSLIYNASYLVPEMIITIVVILLLAKNHRASQLFVADQR